MGCKKINKIWDYVSYIICFCLAVVVYKNGYKYIAGTILILEGFVLYIFNFFRTKNLVDIRGLFSGSWIVGMGLSCLQLSKLQSDWKNMTWISFFCVYFFFMIGFELTEKVITKKEGRVKAVGTLNKDEIKAVRIMRCIIALAGISVACFLLEAIVLGFIPLFSPEPHAYSYFHISGVHYFTVSCILIPAMTVIYTKITENWNKKKVILLLVCNATAFVIPILCVSRFQMLFAVGFAAIIYLMLYRKITWKMIAGVILVVVPLYILLSVARRHDVSYLNGIFEMKNSNMPIFVTQPYIYIAANYDNFNCLVSQCSEFAHGLKMLFPVIALSGLKFIRPELATFPLYTIKTELTTLTIAYDAYYDFGIFGIIGFAIILGIIVKKLTQWVVASKNPVVYMFYGQVAVYFVLSFFTTWFSNPTTWFWLAITLMMYIYIGYEKKEKR